MFVRNLQLLRNCFNCYDAEFMLENENQYEWCENEGDFRGRILPV